MNFSPVKLIREAFLAPVKLYRKYLSPLKSTPILLKDNEWLKPFFALERDTDSGVLQKKCANATKT